MIPIAPDTPALLSATVDEVLNAAVNQARNAGMTPGTRVLSTMDWILPDGLLGGLLTPLAAGAHLVQVTGADPAKLADHRQAERTTIDLP
jgi:hypothetical protein